MSNLYERMLKTYLQDREPEKYERLRKNKELNAFIQSRVNRAIDQKRSMIDSGMPENQADEFARMTLLEG